MWQPFGRDRHQESGAEIIAVEKSPRATYGEGGVLNVEVIHGDAPLLAHLPRLLRQPDAVAGPKPFLDEWKSSETITQNPITKLST